MILNSGAGWCAGRARRSSVTRLAPSRARKVIHHSVYCTIWYHASATAVAADAVQFESPEREKLSTQWSRS
jgi:hypothetical protein